METRPDLAGAGELAERLMDNPEPDDEALGAAAAPYHCDVDPDVTRELLTRIDAGF